MAAGEVWNARGDRRIPNYVVSRGNITMRHRTLRLRGFLPTQSLSVRAETQHAAPLGRYLLVELHENLAAHGTTSNVAVICLKQVPGVATVTDLAAITQETLDVILLNPEPEEEAPSGPKQEALL